MIEEKVPLEQQLNKLLGSAYDDAQKDDVDIEEEGVVEEKKEDDVEPEKVEKKTEKKASKPRNSDGKFKKTEETVDVKQPVDEITDQSMVEPEVVAPVSQAPDHWSAGAKSHWEKLDPVVRAEALKQQDFVNKLQSRHAQERKKYEAIDSVLEPQRNLLRANYGDEATGLKNLFALSDFASKDPRGFVQWFSQQRGIDLRGLVNTQPERAVDPTVNALQQQIQQLTQHINGVTQAQQGAVMSDIDRSFKEFSSNPANKYFEDVREDMAFFIESGKANDWQTAYNMAIKINPSVSELIEAEKLTAIQEKRRKEAEEAANKAQKARSINVSTKGVVNSSEKNGSWSDTLLRTADKLMGA